MNNFKILYLEDDDNDAELIIATLRKNDFKGAIQVVSDEQSFAEKLQSNQYELILLDYQVPSFSGIDALKMLKERSISSPAIVVSGAVGDEEAVQIIRNGAIDYVLKDNLIRLPNSIIRAIKEHQVQQQQKKQEAIQNQLIMSTHAGMFKLDKSGNFQYVNDQLCHLLSTDKTTLLGKSWFQYIYSEDQKTMKKMWQSHVNNTDGFSLECRINSNNDTPSWIQYTCTPEINGKQFDGFLCTVIDITHIKEAQDKLMSLAHDDVLTKLPNRLSFQEKLSVVIEELNRGEITMFGLFYIDLDHFKKVNDTLGHDIGDNLLQEAAKRFISVIRKPDMIARLGGDEFAIIAKNFKSVQHIQHYGNRLLQRFREPFYIKGNECHATLSIGIMIINQSVDSLDKTSLIQRCDQALYRAKAKGRNCLEFYTEKINQEVQQISYLENGLRHAIRNNELYVVYQPQFELESGRFVGCEALIRWNHPEKGNISPNIFIPIAENANLINPISKWIIKTVLRQLEQWQEKFNIPTHRHFIAINLSPAQFVAKQSEKMAYEIGDFIMKHGIDPKNVMFELTETAVMENIEVMKSIFSELNDLGFCIAIDDFGTGYSSLSYLKELPLTMLKIDRSFIKDLETNEHSNAITKSIIMLAQAMKLDVIAEGVETEQQVDFLKTYQCKYVQGYYFAKPMSAIDIETLIRNEDKGSMLKN